MDKITKTVLFFLACMAILFAFFAFWRVPKNTPQEVSLIALANQINENKVKKIEVKNNELTVTLNETEKNSLGQEIDKKERSKKETEASLTETLTNLKVDTEKLKTIEIQVVEASGLSYWAMNLVPIVLPIIVVGIIIFYMAKSIQKGNNRAMMFGRSAAKKVDPKAKNKATFKDIAGIEESKEELLEVVEFLKSPKKFRALGAEIPKGVLLVGPPGTGKTLLARAVAGEANVPFFHIAGSEFVEMFVGVGASRVRDLFNKAKKSAPSILFIDEIDAVGRQRGAGLGGSHDEREQTLNQILTEMDGFEQDTNVIIVAATNRPDILDPALLRPGRFDRRVTIGLPDIKDRTAILKIHSQKKPLAKNIALEKIAQRTPGFTGADLKNLMNEAAILAARHNRTEVTEEDCFEAIEKVMLGPERKSFVLSPREKEITAYHEAGHALVAHSLPHTDPVQKISIISRGLAAGYTLKVPENDKHFETKEEFLEELIVLLAGYATEKLIFGPEKITTGASSDIRMATALARKLVTEYGMSPLLGPMTFGHKEELIFLGKEIGEQRNYSEEVAAKIDTEIQKFIQAASVKADKMVERDKTKLKKLAALLIERETLERTEFEKLFGIKKSAN